MTILHPKYRADIDGLRAIAVLSVITFHAFPGLLQGGFVGVDIFFVISGYLISTIIFKNLDKGIFSFSEFYARRIKRIFPALLLVLIASFAFGWFALLAEEYKQLGKHMLAGAGFFSNYVIWGEAGYFDNSSHTKPLLHLWSLGIEEQFYIVWPLILWLAWKQKFNLLSVTVFIALLSFILNIKGIKQDEVATFYSPQTRFWELLSGSILAWVVLYKKNTWENATIKIDKILANVFNLHDGKLNGKICSNILSIFGALFLVFGFFLINKYLSFPGIWPLIPVAGTILIILAGPQALFNHFLLSNKFAVWFGLISFPLYLWHWPLLSFARIIEGGIPSLNIRIIAVILSIFLAWLTYKFIESPIRFGGHNKAKVSVLLLLMISIGYVGYATYSNNGFDKRESIKDYVQHKIVYAKKDNITKECLNYVGIKNLLFNYCKFSNIKSTETIAVIGDSHAVSAYTGISEFLERKGLNSVLLANNGCPPFLGVTTGKNQLEKDACTLSIKQLIDTLTKLKDVKKVFIFTRGAFYNKGTEPVSGDLDLTNKESRFFKGNEDIIPLRDFFEAAQLTVQTLVDNGKKVFYVTENPELNFTIESCIDRPLKTSVKDCSLDLSSVLIRQGEYLRLFSTLKNVTFINSLPVFCPKNKCVVFDENGALLYIDDDHLSPNGSKFQVENLLIKYL